MQILLIQGVDFSGQIRPAQTSTQPFSKFVLRDLNLGGFIDAMRFSGFSLATLFDQLELPAKEVV